jgi:hypothetical protein
MGTPQCGQAEALLQISFPHSGHFMSAIAIDSKKADLQVRATGASKLTRQKRILSDHIQPSRRRALSRATCQIPS